jgi:hypothetical protein
MNERKERLKERKTERKKVRLWECVPSISVFAPNDFHEIWCKPYTFGDHSNLALLTFLKSVLTAAQMYELVKWELHLMYSSEIMYGKSQSCNPG